MLSYGCRTIVSLFPQQKELYMLRNFVFCAFMLGSCTYMGMKTQTEGFWFLMWGTCVAACRQWGFLPCLQCEAESKGWVVSSCSSAETEYLTSFGYQWGWVRECCGRRWGQMRSGLLLHELRGQCISTRSLPSAISSQTGIGRFFSWF